MTLRASGGKLLAMFAKAWPYAALLFSAVVIAYFAKGLWRAAVSEMGVEGQAGPGRAHEFDAPPRSSK